MEPEKGFSSNVEQNSSENMLDNTNTPSNLNEKMLPNQQPMYPNNSPAPNSMYPPQQQMYPPQQQMYPPQQQMYPPQQQMYPPQQPMNPGYTPQQADVQPMSVGQPMVSVVSNQVQPNQDFSKILKTTPAVITCPYCGKTGMTNVKTECSCLNCCCCLCTSCVCWIIFQACRGKDINCQNAVHTCSSCNQTVYNYEAC